MSDLQRHQHCYDYAELEAERDRLVQQNNEAVLLVARLREAIDRRNDKVTEVMAERDRLLAHNEELGTALLRLQREVDALKSYQAEDAAERDRLVKTVNRLISEAKDMKGAHDRLRARNGRLRKAVNWLRGALHDEGLESVYPRHYGTVETCDVWECQRGRVILEEAKDE